MKVVGKDGVVHGVRWEPRTASRDEYPGHTWCGEPFGWRQSQETVVVLFNGEMTSTAWSMQETTEALSCLVCLSMEGSR